MSPLHIVLLWCLWNASSSVKQIFARCYHNNDSKVACAIGSKLEIAALLHLERFPTDLNSFCQQEHTSLPERTFDLTNEKGLLSHK